MVKYKRLVTILVAAIVFILMGLPALAQNGSQSYGGIKFPLGDKSFADQVVDFDVGSGTGESDGSAVIGPSDCGKNTGPSVAGAKGDVSLGTGGSITLKFTDNYLIDVKGLDLYVFEYGGDVEPFKVEISKDGSGWIDLGTVRGQPTGLDIHDKVTPGDRFSYVRITDANPYSPRDPKIIGTQAACAGADIDAVGAIGAEEKQDEVPNVKNPPTSTPGVCDWTGTWETSWGKMELVQTGNTRTGADITGTATLVLPQRRNTTGGYKTYDGYITAIALGNKLVGNWSKPPSYGRPEDSGRIEFIISDDCNSFDGNWQQYSSGTYNWDGVWTGRRTGSGSSSPPTEQPSKEIVCASAKPSYTAGGEFKPAWFTIGGSVPQKVRITSSAENYAITKEYGEVVFSVIKGKSWGSLTLEPGTYILSCNGGGAMGLMSASVCVEFPSSNQVPLPPSSGGQIIQPDPDPKNKEKPPTKPIGNDQPSLPPGPIERIIIRPIGDSNKMTSTLTGKMMMAIGKKEHFIAWGVDANNPNYETPVIVDKWKVSDENIGSIDNNGLFKAGQKKGKVEITATVKNQAGNKITGTFLITVSADPPITFRGCVKLYNEHGIKVSADDVRVTLSATPIFKNRAAYDQVNPALREVGHVKTDRKGRFEFELALRGKYLTLGFGVRSANLNHRAPVGYEWWPGKGNTNKAQWTGQIKDDTAYINIAPCLKLYLEKMSVSAGIAGKVTHKGKPVEKAKVKLLHNGQILAETKSWTNGYYKLDVGNLLKGNYKLTAQYKPLDENKPSGPGNFVTLSNWLIMRKDISVNLPLPPSVKTARDIYGVWSQIKTIDINLISWKQKIGYREIGVKGGSTKPPGVSNREPSRSNSLEWNDRPWVIDNNNNNGNGTYQGSGSGWEDEPVRRPGRDVIFDRNDRSGIKGSGDDDNVHHNTDTNWGKPPSMEPYQKYNFE